MLRNLHVMQICENLEVCVAKFLLEHIHFRKLKSAFNNIFMQK